MALTLKNSVGNVTEILHLLDKDVYSGEQIRTNYEMLIGKWGEWEVFGQDSAGLVIRYVDVGEAMFSGFMRLYSTLAIITFCLAVILGKIIFPWLSKLYKDANEEMVDLATLTSATQINQLTEAKKAGKEWF